MNSSTLAITAFPYHMSPQLGHLVDAQVDGAITYPGGEIRPLDTPVFKINQYRPDAEYLAELSFFLHSAPTGAEYTLSTMIDDEPHHKIYVKTGDDCWVRQGAR